MKKNYFIFLLILFSFFSVKANINLTDQQKEIAIELFLDQKPTLKKIVTNSQNIDFLIPDPKKILTEALELEKLSQYHNDDVIRAKALLIIGVVNRELNNYKDAQKYLNQCYALAYKMNNLEMQGQVYSAFGHIYREQKDYDKALEFNTKALKLYEKAKSEEGINIAYKDIGGVYYWKSEYLEGISYFKKALPYFEKIKNEKRFAQLSVNIGMSYLTISDFSKSIKYFDAAEKIYLENNYTDGIAWVSNYLGIVYQRAGNNEKAFEYFNKALNIYRERKDYSGQMQALSLLADIYLEQNKKEKAMQNYTEALAIGKENKLNEMMSRVYFNIASNIYWENQIDKTLYYLDLAEAYASKSTQAKIWSLKAEIYNKKGEFNQAKVFSEKSLLFHKMSDEKEQLKLNYQVLSEINKNTGDYKSALENYKLFKAYDESLKKEDASKTILKYEFEQKESDLKAKQQAEIIRKNTFSYITYAVLGVVILLVGFVLYIFWIRNKKLHLEKQNLDFKRREAELAKDTEEFKARFLSNISHEFRTPLTLINGHLEILKKDSDKKNAKRYDEMEFSGKRLLQLINQLLDLTKLETGKYTLYYKKGNLLNEIQNYIQAFNSLAKERKIELTTTLSFAARTKFTQLDFAYSSEALASIFNNLLSNALKFTPIDGSVHVNIDYLGGKLYVAVRDSGLGIPTEDITKIFDRFYQVTQQEKPIYEGSGIGLAIVKELAQYHGGDAEVINNPEGGCTFSVWLAEGINISEKTNIELVYTPPLNYSNAIVDIDDNTDKPIVLVVEDQQELRKFIVENLGLNYRFLEATNGKQGIEMALEYLPEIIISDVMMPEIDGFQLTKSLKTNEITSHIPILLLTAKAEHNDKIEGLKYGADDYLTKPFSIAELQLRVKNRLQQQEVMRNKFSEDLVLSNSKNTPELNDLDRNFIEKLNNFVIQNIENEIDVTLLASEIGLSNSQLTRKLKVMLGVTPANLIRNIRMDSALKLLKNGYTVSEASWKTGFEEPAYFSKVFKKHFGFLPSDKEKF